LDVTSNYESLKKAIFEGFNKTPDAYRLDFSSLKIGSDETYRQFVTQLTSKFDQWISANKVEKNYNNVRDFIITDQFLASVSPDLRVFLKEQRAGTLDEMTEWSDSWAMAHKSYPKSSFPSRNYKQSNNLMSSAGPSDRTTISNNSDKNNAYIKPKTYPFKRDLSRVTCYHCKELGHVQSRCPILKGLPVRREGVQNAVVETNPGEDNVHRVNFTFSENTHRKYRSCGTVNGQSVSTIWRDTGCSAVIVADNVLPNIDINNCKTIKVSDYLGNVSKFPLCRIYLKCPFYCGWVEAIRAPLNSVQFLLVIFRVW
jgi:hypothetical protein